MPWQPSGNGRSGWSTKLIRGLKAEAAAGFQSRRERCREPTPVTPQYAAFPTYKAARVHRTYWWWCGGMAVRRSRAADNEVANDRVHGFGHILDPHPMGQCICGPPARTRLRAALYRLNIAGRKEVMSAPRRSPPSSFG